MQTEKFVFCLAEVPFLMLCDILAFNYMICTSKNLLISPRTKKVKQKKIEQIKKKCYYFSHLLTIRTDFQPNGESTKFINPLEIPKAKKNTILFLVNQFPKTPKKTISLIIFSIILIDQP
jgi:hypothetical protein